MKMKSVLSAFAAGVASVLIALGPAAEAGAVTKTQSVTRSTAVEAQGAVSAKKARKLYDIRMRVKPNNLRGHVGVAWAPSLAIKELHRCFNCTFPIKGAPKKYPKENQHLSLKACAAGPFGCRNAPVRYHGGVKNGWYFTAEKGHFDGAGSKVYFQFYSEKNTHYLMLHVWAYVTHPTVPDAINKSFATGKWQDFNHKMGVKLWCQTYGHC
ncbi:hypothetical protein [Streptomyces sp. HUAS TT20]|uniref:hypothetical protein n=1 Tax=Streptomyces sp. HUAS TT20 TaxID=3447509 RepID=UPI0021D9716A|nr:hypothetical protein [Streptomyces sp. HUAS 15-9]UXY30193.1 hypothetical protein N8I87_29010 [Streptomyces sp. HUAS 15-9]